MADSFMGVDDSAVKGRSAARFDSFDSLEPSMLEAKPRERFLGGLGGRKEQAPAAGRAAYAWQGTCTCMASRPLRSPGSNQPHPVTLVNT